MTRATSAIARRWRAVAGAASAATIGLGLLMLGCAGVAMAGPRAGVLLETNAVRKLVAQAAPDAKVIVASEPFTQAVDPEPTAPPGQLAGVGGQLRANLAGLPLAPKSADLMAFTTGFSGLSDSARSLGPNTGAQFEFVYQTGLASHARVVEGSLPAALPRSRGRPVFPIAITVATARRFGLRLGSSVPFSSGSGSAPGSLKVTAIIEPVQPANAFWALDPIQYTPTLVLPAKGNPYWQGGAFISAPEVVRMEQQFGTSSILRWVLPLRLGKLTGSQAITLATTLPTALVQDGSNLQVNPGTSGFTAALSAGITTVLVTFAQQATAVLTLLRLLSVSLTAVCAAVLLLAVWLLTEQRYAEFATLRSRGASRRQLGWLALRGCLLTVLPGAALGVAIAIAATPGSGAALGWWLSGLALLTVVAGLPLLTMRRHKASGTSSERQDAPTGKRAASRRLVIEATLVLAAVGGLIVMRDQGLAPGGADVYTSLAPVLVAVPVAIVVLRCYPLLARPALRLTGRRPGVAAFVGVARAIRTAVTAGLPVFGMVLALTLVAFAGMVHGSVLRGEVAASWQSVGADAVVTDPAGLDPAAQRAIGSVPGAQHIAALTISSAVFPGGSTSFGVVGVNPGQYDAFLASIPGSAVPATALAGRVGGAFPALATPGLAPRLRRAGATVDVADQPVRVRLTGQISAAAALSALSGGQYVVLPRAVLPANAGPPVVMLILGSRLNDRDLSRVLAHVARGASVTFRAPMLAALEDAPLQHGAYVGFTVGSVVAAALSVLVLLLALVIGGRSRRLTIARMNTMGLTVGQGRRLVVLEVVPQVLAAMVGGAAAAALLAPLVGPSLDLSVFTGTAASVPVRIEPAFLGAAALALAVLALVTLIVQTAVANRTVASALRIGE